MDQVVQQNAALVEESAAAAQNLAEQAEGLAALAVRFRVDEEPAEAPQQARQDAAPSRVIRDRHEGELVEAGALQ
jgi:hypothetical protein